MDATTRATTPPAARTAWAHGADEPGSITLRAPGQPSFPPRQLDRDDESIPAIAATTDITSITVKVIRLVFTPLNFPGDPVAPGAEHLAATTATPCDWRNPTVTGIEVLQTIPGPIPGPAGLNSLVDSPTAPVAATRG